MEAEKKKMKINIQLFNLNQIYIGNYVKRKWIKHST